MKKPTFYKYIDVATGQFCKSPNSMTHKERERRLKKASVTAWWAVGGFTCEEPHPQDAHVAEVYLCSASQCCISPVWPVLALYDVGAIELWMRRLAAFAKPLSADTYREHHDDEINGDRRLAAWLKQHGFVRVNHIWWREVTT